MVLIAVAAFLFTNDSDLREALDKVAYYYLDVFAPLVIVLRRCSISLFID